MLPEATPAATDTTEEVNASLLAAATDTVRLKPWPPVELSE